jgi:murein DD-endopeptidase MepM/ murein hydrolase activator NlpD
MGKIKFDDKQPLIKNKFFYAALAICLLAMGISTYGAVTKIKRYEPKEQTPPQSTVSFAEVNEPVSHVPYPEPKEETVTQTDTATEDDTVLTEAAPFFSLPVTGEVIKNFSNDTLQYSQTFKDWRLHLGVDIAAEKGDVVFSCAQGVVEDIYNDSAYGTVIAIDHGNGLMAFYCGMNRTPTVKIGDTVESGSQLGVLDTVPCESVEQFHLHLEMEQDGVQVSPLLAMGMMEQ